MWGCFVFLLFLATGCRTTHVAPPPMVITNASLVKIQAVPELADYPIVDIHSHTFNARYLPVENIALARRYDVLPLGLGYLFPDNWVVHVARVIVRRTELSPTTNETTAVAPVVTDAKEVRDAAVVRQTMAEEVAQQKARVPKIAVTNAIADDDLPVVNQQGTPRKPTDKQLNNAAVRLFKPKPPRKGGKPIETPDSSIWRFLDILTSRENRLRRLLIEQEFPEVALFVHHMMDLGPVYGQSPHGRRFLNFTTEQISRSEVFDRKSDGKFIRFVAFSPFRATNDFEDAWRPVEEALAQGAWGIKIYPPSGYRPTDNKIPRKPWCPPILRQQWDSRYARMTGKKLDEIMLKFFERCVQRDIPVFAHCSYGEFQAAKGYGESNADPRYWLKLFQKNPQLANLRLCLGHAGGADFWLGFGDFAKWGTNVLAICATYPNVYCEFGAMDGILGEENGLSNSVYFANRMLDCFKKTDGRFAKKVMYGSDWFMPMAANPRADYLNAYREAFLTPELRDYYKDFFCRNALSYLKLSEQRVADDGFLSPEAKTRLRAMLEKAQR